MTRTMLLKDDIVEIWQKWWWKHEFDLQINSWEPFSKAFLRSANKLVENDLTSWLLSFSRAYYPWVVSDVRAFQRRIAWILFDDAKWKNIEEILIALWETNERVKDVLQKVDEQRKTVAMSWIRPKNEQINKSIILTVWNNWWKQKFEENIEKWMNFWEALIKSVREIDSWLKEISLRFSSITSWWRSGFVNLIWKTLLLQSYSMRDILLVLYKWDTSKVDIIIKSISKNNKQKNNKTIARNIKRT